MSIGGPYNAVAIEHAVGICASLTRFTVEEWEPAVMVWWSAGHDPAQLVDWVRDEPRVTPGFVEAAIRLLNSPAPLPRRRT